MSSCAQMPFTRSAYRDMLRILKERGYGFCGYDDWKAIEKPVILRHDIDFDPVAALEMAELESREGARSTYFVLLRTDFYNPLERHCAERLKSIAGFGHNIGLHFDETQYSEAEDVPAAIERETVVLNSILGVPVRCVSMHRPSRASLEADWSIPGIINSYSKVFFQGFEYVSDSRMNWRKSVLDLIQSDEYPRLQILTHPFWYGETESSLEESLERFAARARFDRIASLDRNFTELDAVLDPTDVMAARLSSLQGMRLQTDRLSLRPLRLDDAADMFEYTSMPEVSHFLNWCPHGKTGEAASWMASNLARSETGDLLLGVELCESGKLIGAVRAYRFDAFSGSCEIFYALNPLYQGRGYMGEALRSLTDLCFERAGIDKIVARVDGENEASAQVARRLGMTRVPCEDFAVPIKNENRLQHVYVIERTP